MIHLIFNIRNPWSNRFENIKSWHGSTPFKHKYWELQIYKSSDILDFNLNITVRQSHSGVRVCFGLIGYNIDFDVYDHRHWNNDTNSFFD